MVRADLKTLRLKATETTLAAEILASGGLVAFPTETVFGIGADATNAVSVAKIFVAKGRPSDNPLIVHLPDVDAVAAYVELVTPAAQRLMERFFPGPLTLVLPKTSRLPDIVTAGLSTVAIRVPSNPLAREIIARSGVAIAAPSANVSGKPSGTRWQSVLDDLDGRIDAIVCADTEMIGIESTVVDISSYPPVLLRAGAISFEQLQDCEPTIRHSTKSSGSIAKSPGLRYRHYQPRAHVRIVTLNAPIEFEPASAWIGLSKPPVTESLPRVLVCKNLAQYAAELYEFFRQCDRDQLLHVYCESVSETGLGLGLMDRLNRAARR